MSNNPKIIIVGAGAAGIAAACRLFENGLNNLLILEAQNRIGGRIHSVEFADGIVDLGAQWCHGEVNNSVYNMVKEFNLLSRSFNDYTDFKFCLSNGSTLDKDVTQKFMQICSVIEDEFIENSEVTLDTTYGDCFTKRFNELISEVFDIDKDIKEWSTMALDLYRRHIMCYESCKSLDDLAIKGIEGENCEGYSYWNWRDKGYKTIFDILMKKIPDRLQSLPIEDKILLNKEVNKVVWHGPTAIVSCTDGSAYPCDHLLFTVSVGVLKNLLSNFEPPLPEKKQTAIKTIPMGATHKIFMKFSHKWWEDDFSGISFLWNDDDRKWAHKEFSNEPTNNERSWVEDIFGFFMVDYFPTVLIVWLGGPMVEEIENLPDNLVVNGCLRVLKYFLKEKYDGTIPEETIRPKWCSNSNFNGVYTYSSRECEKAGVSFDDLTTPVATLEGKEILLFAGEGTHSQYFGTVHGAIDSGFREADRLLKMYKDPKFIHRKVAIVGAGMAGLGAATTLQQLGCVDFVIVEAQDSPGGRIRSLEIDGNIIELGAQWIHGKDNPLFELAHQHQLISDVTSEEGLGLYIRDNGELVDPDLVKKVDFIVGSILTQCELFMNSLEHPPSVGEFLEQKFLEYLKQCEDPDDVKAIKMELFDWHVRFQLIDNSCLDLTQLSAKYWGKYSCIEDKAHINLNCCYGKLVEILVEQLPKCCIILGTPVAEIQYTKSDYNRIICDNGLVITCDYVILTVPLPLLKEIRFVPNLPRNLVQNGLGFNAIGKIFLIFNCKWWNNEGFQFLWRRNSEEKSWIRYIQGFDSVVGGPNVLLGWVGGKGVEIMENLSEETIAKDCIQLLQRFIRSRSIPQPSKVIRTTWLSNPWIRGSYSHITTLADYPNSGIHQLAEPILVDSKPRILIAGEASHSRHYSTTHGAFESGQEQAKLLADHIMNYASK